MKYKQKIYLIKNLPEETIAVCFARCSRCSSDFASIAAELDEDRSRRFHERWVVGYGHSSVAEHAVAHVAFENVSRLVTENIQSNRLASYTEVSTRYQIIGQGRYFIPQKIREDKFLFKVYKVAIENLFKVYDLALEPVRKEIVKIYPREENESERQYEGRIRSKYIDVARMVLPMCILTNLGMTANARSLEHAITKLLSSPYEEAQLVGQELKKTVLKSCPTLVKYAQKSDYMSFVNQLDSRREADRILGKKRGSRRAVEVVWHDPVGKDRFIAAMLYRSGRGNLKSLFRAVKKWSTSKKKQFLGQILGRIGKHEKVPRELEHVYLTFDCLIDQGGYYDLKRNRMMTQTVQGLTIDYGYVIPLLWVRAGLKREYIQAFEELESAYRQVVPKYPLEAAYLVTKAHKRRFLMTMNLRELFYFVPLRGGIRGHPSYRRIAMKCFEEARKIYPDLLKYVRVKNYQGSVEIEKEFFFRT
jgi:thymidylate synthase ThyX